MESISKLSLLLASSRETAVAVAVVVSLSWLILRLFSSHPTVPLPPGPRGKPIIGNLYDMPRPDQPQWLFWLKHKNLYGPISSVSTLGRTVIVVNDLNLARDLLETNSKMTASRPWMPFAGDLVGWKNMSTFQTPSTGLQAYRRALHRVLGSQSIIDQFRPGQQAETAYFLSQVRQQPNDFARFFQSQMGAVVLRTAYGYKVDRSGNDPIVSHANLVVGEFAKATSVGAWLVDTLPILRYIPAWMPGAGFKTSAKKYGRNLQHLADKPYSFVKAQRALGNASPSYVSTLLSHNENEHTTKWTAASLYLGATISTAYTLETFVLAMAKYPDAQRKAQEELHRVCPDRMPQFEDCDQLPYVNALIKETIRWIPIAPIGFPHAVSQDIICGGYRIPEGAVIIPNVWGFLHDPSTFRDPMEFIPERFFDTKDWPAEPDLTHTVFGWGRRACPGRKVADSALFLTTAQFLRVFEVKKALDDTSHEIEPLIEVKAGTVVHPEPFPVRIVLQSDEHGKLLDSHLKQFKWDDSDAEKLKAIPE